LIKFNPVRKIYDWVLGWAEKESSLYALSILAFAESSFFPVPVDVLLIPLVLGNRKKWFKLFMLTTTFSVLGGIFGYLIGFKLWWTLDGNFTSIAEFFFRIIPGFSKELFWTMQQKYDLYNFWIVFTAGFTPIPFKIITISAGAFKINLITFLVAALISRGLRFFIVSFLIYLVGEPVKKFIDKYFNILAIIFTFLLIGGFLVIKGLI